MSIFGKIEGWTPPVNRKTTHPERLGKKPEKTEAQLRVENEEIRAELESEAKREQRKGAWHHGLSSPNSDN